MKNNRLVTDGNEACASVAYRLSETIAIFPITPSSPMAESSDEWAAKGKQNVWGVVPEVSQMQSEAGVAGAVHGALMGGSQTTTFTASQGLLLMIPNMYKIAGELTPFVMHVTARTIATHALSIFGDHSDVMGCRQTGFAMLASNSVQEAHDMAAISHAATLESNVPFMHFFDGFRTSHEINSYEALSDEVLKKMIDPKALAAFRKRALSPDSPQVRGTAQNPDVFFQAREAINPFYNKLPEVVSNVMVRFAELTGRHYGLVEYEGHPEAEDVIVIMGSGAETAATTAIHLNEKGKRVGVVKVRLYRPFSAEALIKALPDTTKRIAVLDRTKEPGALGEPLYQDVITSLASNGAIVEQVVGGRYGLGSKEFSPAMVKGVFDTLEKGELKHGFTVGINDDVTLTSIGYDDKFELPIDQDNEKLFEALFIGLGADGTVGANKNSIKIIGDKTDFYSQAYFVYDSKKSGSMTASHLRFGSQPIRSPYLIAQAPFVAVHNFAFFERYDLLAKAAEGATVLLNSMYSAEDVFNKLPRNAQEHIVNKKLKLYTIDAFKVAKETGMGGRINTIMQTCFFAISGVIEKDEAIAAIKEAAEKTYMRKGKEVVEKNFKAIDASLANLYEVPTPTEINAAEAVVDMPQDAPDFVKQVTSVMLADEGDKLPVSAFPVDGAWITGTTKYEKRNIAQALPQWDPELCIQCGKCSFVCPHSAIRSRFYDKETLEAAPEGFASTKFRSKEFPEMNFTIQVSPDDCTGCSLCAHVCPAISKDNPEHKALDMQPHKKTYETEKKRWDYFEKIELPERTQLGNNVKFTQFKEPLFEFSGACAGCGETPYIRLLTQLFGDRLLMANATGCSSIYGGNLPTTPYTTNKDGRGPAWANSLFEDNAEFGYGLRLAADKKTDIATILLKELAPKIGDELVSQILENPQEDEAQIEAQRKAVAAVREAIKGDTSEHAQVLTQMADALVKKTLWIVGGDGWAYDIGFGGLDHVMAQGRNTNILVIDTEVYSNTGGQMSKSTPMGAIAKFAAAGKAANKKDLGLMMMGYGNAYIASVAFGAKDSHTLQVLQEAESFPGPSLVMAYSHCISHGFDLSCGLDHHKKAIDTGYWMLYRYDPRRDDPLKLDMKAPSKPVSEWLAGETRFKALKAANPERAEEMAKGMQQWVDERWAKYQKLVEDFKKPTPEA